MSQFSTVYTHKAHSPRNLRRLLLGTLTGYHSGDGRHWVRPHWLAASGQLGRSRLMTSPDRVLATTAFSISTRLYGLPLAGNVIKIISSATSSQRAIDDPLIVPIVPWFPAIFAIAPLSPCLEGAPAPPWLGWLAGLTRCECRGPPNQVKAKPRLRSVPPWRSGPPWRYAQTRTRYGVPDLTNLHWHTYGVILKT